MRWPFARRGYRRTCDECGTSHQRQEGAEGTEREIAYVAGLNRRPRRGGHRYRQERA